MVVSKSSLVIIADAIARIEDKDPDYTNNDVWKRLKQIEEDAYKTYAEQEISRNQERLNCGVERVSKEAKEIIDACEDFLGVYNERNR